MPGFRAPESSRHLFSAGRPSAASDLAAALFRINVRQEIGMEWRGWQMIRGARGCWPLGCVKQVGHLVGIQPLRVLLRKVIVLIGAQENAKLEPGYAQVVIGQEDGAADTLAIDARAVRAAQVAQEQEAVRFDDQTMHFRDALVVQAQITIFLASHQREIIVDVDRRRAVKRDKLGSHDYTAAKEKDHAAARPPPGLGCAFHSIRQAGARSRGASAWQPPALPGPTARPAPSAASTMNCRS